MGEKLINGSRNEISILSLTLCACTVACVYVFMFRQRAKCKVSYFSFENLLLPIHLLFVRIFGLFLASFTYLNCVCVVEMGCTEI